MSSPRRPLPSPPVCLAIVAVALAIGIFTGILAAGDRILPGDIRLATQIQRASGPVATALADIGNTVGWTAWAAMVLVLAIVVAALLRSWTDVIYLGTLLVLRVVAIPLKAVFASPRPTADVVTINGAFDGYGFPSGHSLTGATLCLGLAVLAWRHIPSRRLAVATVLVLIALMLDVGWARVWVGAHWPSDVVGGFAFGVVIVAIGVIVTEWAAAKRAMTSIART